MYREMSTLDDVFSDAGRSIPTLAGLAPVSGATPVNPSAIARQIFGVDFTLTDRNQLIAQIERVLPIDTSVAGTPAIGLQRDPAASPDGAPRVGPFAQAYFAANLLLQNVPLFAEIRPLEGSETCGCDHQTVVGLATNAITEIANKLSTPELPLPDRVDNLLGTLCGYDPKVEQKPLTVQSVAGHLGAIRIRCGLDIGNVCTVADENVLTAFSNIVLLTGSLVQTWHGVRNSDGGNFLSVAVYPLRRHLGAIVCALVQVRDLVPSSVWTAEVQSTPRIVAWDVYQWIYQYAAQGAVRDLQTGGRDAVCVVARTFGSIRDLFERTFVQGSTATDRCAGIPAAFTDDKVKPVLEDISCHMKRVIDVARELVTDETCQSYGRPSATTPTNQTP